MFEVELADGDYVFRARAENEVGYGDYSAEYAVCIGATAASASSIDPFPNRQRWKDRNDAHEVLRNIVCLERFPKGKTAIDNYIYRLTSAVAHFQQYQNLGDDGGLLRLAQQRLHDARNACEHKDRITACQSTLRHLLRRHVRSIISSAGSYINIV
jgi:hypothetical protein